MDIRDLRGTLVPYDKLTAFEDIFELQKELLRDYAIIEIMPAIPFDLDIKTNQLLIKDFISRIIEEIGEGYDSLNEVNSRNDIEKDEIIYAIQNFNEEMADALHFLTETTIVSGINIEDIHNYAEACLSDSELIIRNSEGNEHNTLETLYTLAYRLNEDEELLPYSGKPIVSDPSLDEPFMKGGQYPSSLFLKEFSRLAWLVTYELMIARNSLKNKAWKQTQMTTDEVSFRAQIIRAWITLIRLFLYSGINQESLFTIYYYKNQVNRFRIKSKY